MKILTLVVGFMSWLTAPQRNERGGDSGVGTIVLILGALAIAGIVVAAITVFVNGKVGELGSGT